MALTSDQISAQNFADFYQTILPYLNGGGVGLKLLWENSDPISNFSAGDVTLSSSDYDMLIVMYRMTTSRNYIKSVVIPKLSTAYLDAGYFTSADNQVIYYRTLSSVDDLTVHIYNASKAANSRETADNSVCIPYRIYGIKVYNRDALPAESLSDVTYTANTTNLQSVNFRRCGNVVTMNFVSKAISVNTNTELLTLDSDFRPINDIVGVCNSGDVSKFGQVMIEASTGKVTIYSSVATSGYYGHLTFVIK